MRSILVWDMPTRLFHWLLVACVALAWLTGGEEEWLRLHAAAGYSVGLLVLWRVLWGLTGSRYARFSSFMFAPAEIAAFARSLLQGKPPRFVGHNPVGSLAIIGFLVLGLSIPLLGHLALLDEQPGLALGGGAVTREAAAPDVRAEREADEEEVAEQDGQAHAALAGGEHEAESVWKEAHEAAANAILLLALLHVVGVVLEGRLQRENLSRAMVTGRKQGVDSEAIGTVHLPMGGVLILLVVAFQAFYWLV